MSILAIVGIALGLSLDAFAVAVATSVILRSVSKRQVFRLGFHFGLFQGMMPVIGWAAGRFVADHIQKWDHWVAFCLLLYVGLKAIYEAARGHRAAQTRRSDPTRGMSLVILSVATSIDALAVGLSFAMLSVEIWYPCVIIGFITACLTTTGMIFGNRLGARFGRRTEMLGGLVLIGVGVKILLDHTVFAAPL